MDHRIIARRPDIVFNLQEKRTYHLVDFVILADQRMRYKESKKIDNT